MLEQEESSCLLHGILRSVTVLCIDAVNRTSSLHEARFFDGPVPCMCLFQHTEGDALLPGLSLRASNERETPMLLRLDRMSVMEWDPSEGEEYEAGECCRLCVGDSLQHRLDTPLPGWAALPLEAEGDEEAESVALKDGLAVFALEEKEKGGSGHE